MDQTSAALNDLATRPSSASTVRGMHLLCNSIMLLVSAALMLYALTRAFVWDEGFHLLAAQLILRGKRPYIDFCFPQTPLNAYWNAAWMALFGQRWQISHIAAASLLIATVWLVVDFVRSQYPLLLWREACTITALLFAGTTETVVQFGPIAQAYAMSMFTGFAAFRLCVWSVRRGGMVPSLAAGIFAGISAGSSLLTAPIALVLILWLTFRNHVGSRWAKLLAFCCGYAIPFVPVLWLFFQAPHLVFFNVVQYQALFRRVNWEGAAAHDLDVLTSWTDSGQTLLLVFLAVAGIVSIKHRDANDDQSRDFRLAAWISLALILYISTAHPTFGRYYIVAIPFLACLAGPGLHFVASRLVSPDKPFWPTAALVFLLLIATGRALFNDRDAATWQRYEEIAKKIAQVTPRNAMLFADEQVYFLLRWTPPSGMEFSYSHKLDLPAREAAALHIISEKELQKQVNRGVFPTFQTCNDDRIDDWGIEKLYKSHVEIADCSVFWGYKGR